MKNYKKNVIFLSSNGRISLKINGIQVSYNTLVLSNFQMSVESNPILLWFY